MELEKTRKNLLIVVVIIVALVAILFSTQNHKIREKAQMEELHAEDLQSKLDNTPIIAKAVSVYNITKNNKIYSKNDQIALPIASLAKILTVTMALNNHRHIGGPDFTYITPEAINQAGDFGLFANEKWNINDLAKLTLIVSANDGAYTLASGPDFIQKLNEKAKKIGAENTLFLNPTGLDLDLTHPGAFASAEDVNTMAMYALADYPEIFEATRASEINFTSLSGFQHNFKNTNIIIDKIPNLIFSKTGFTDAAGGNLTVIFKNTKGEEVLITVLGSTFAGRFDDMETLVNILYNS